MSDWCPENDGAYRAEMAARFPVANRKRIAELEAKLARAEDALIWCSGHPDFNEGGTCREGWLRVCAPILAELTGESHE